MDHKKQMNDVITFAAIVFAPIAFILFVILLPGILINILISFTSPSSITSSLPILLEALAFIGGFYLVSVICFHQYFLTNSIMRKFLIMYISWLCLSYPIIFVLLNALGGVSMAIVDSASGSYMTRLPYYLTSSALVLLYGHIIIFPWIWAAHQIVQKVFDRDKNAPRRNRDIHRAPFL